MIGQLLYYPFTNWIKQPTSIHPFSAQAKPLPIHWDEKADIIHNSGPSADW